MSQPAISKHLQVLERAGLIARGRDAQRRPRRLEAQPLAEANLWVEAYRRCWEEILPTPRYPARRNEDHRQKTRTPEKVTGAGMNPNETLQITTPTDRKVVLTHAPRALVFDAPRRGRTGT